MGEGIKTIGILVGGGPAPGINGVISAATIEAVNRGWNVLGIMEGFKWLSRGDTRYAEKLTIHGVSRIHWEGGSILRTSRENPTKDPDKMENVVRSLNNLHIDALITIGGDDTAYTASRVEKEVKGNIRVVHVPKTIDNDLPLPGGVPTFGFETARTIGVQLVMNLMEDARTSNRWYIVVTMGRRAGHLALGIGKAAGATLTVIPEGFRGKPITLGSVCDIVEGAVIKRLSMDREDGVAVLAEGLGEFLTPEEIDAIGAIRKDEHGHIRLGDLELGAEVRNVLRTRLEERGIKIGFVDLNIGYELRSAAPIPFDIEYTRDLGFGAVEFLSKGGSGAMISVHEGALAPIPFPQIMDPATGKTKVRMIDVDSMTYRVARHYMIRLDKEDITVPDRIEALAKAGRLTPEAFVKKFSAVIT